MVHIHDLLTYPEPLAHFGARSRLVQLTGTPLGRSPQLPDHGDVSAIDAETLAIQGEAIGTIAVT
jgi:hypothetical protein